MTQPTPHHLALAAGQGERLAELFAAERTHDLFFTVRPDREVPKERRAYLHAAKAVLPPNFIRHLKLKRCLLPVADISGFCPREMAELYLDLAVCAIEEDDHEMLAQLHAAEPKNSVRIGSALDVLGHGWMTTGRFREAIAAYDLALQFDSPGRSVYANALWVAQKDNTGLPIDPERNARWLARCLPEGRENPDIFFNAACVYVEEGKHDAALEHILKSLAYGSSLEKVRGMASDAMFDVIRAEVDALLTEPPPGVRSDAWWSPEDNEWVWGEKDDKGRFQGPVHYWRPGGTLACVTEHVNGSPDGKFTRTHEDGTVSREGHIHGTVLYGVDTTHRSSSWSSEAKAMWSKISPAIHSVATHWAERGATPGFTHQVFRDREGRELSPSGDPLPQRPPNVAPSAVLVDDLWSDGFRSADSGQVGLWRHHALGGELVREEFYDDEGKLQHTTLPSERSDAALERGQHMDGEWMGPVELLDEAMQSIGSYDPTGADRLTDVKLAQWVAEVRAVDWASLESAYEHTERVCHHLIVFGLSASEEEDERRSRALRRLYGHICHQGSTYEASQAALPLLVQLALVSKSEAVQREALQLVEHMSLVPRGLYEHWKTAGHPSEDTRAVSACTEVLASIATTFEGKVRVNALRCLAGCFDNPKAATFLAEGLESAPPNERALRVAALGNLRAVPRKLLGAIADQPPLMQLALIYGCAMSDQDAEPNAAKVPDALERVLALVESGAIEDETLQAGFGDFPCVDADDSVLDELAFMVRPDSDTIDGLITRLLTRLSRTRGGASIPAAECALRLAHADEDFEGARSRVLKAIADKDDLWQDEHGRPRRLNNLIELLERFELPDDRDELRASATEEDE